MKTFKQLNSELGTIIEASIETPLSHILKNPGKKLPMHLDPNRPFDPDPPKKKPIAVAGKYGQGYSTAKHLAKQGMASAKKEEAELDEAKYQKLSAQQKFKNSMKRAGYDMDAGAKRLQDLLDKQKKEREEREKKGVAEGSLTEMDESSPQPGRDGEVSHKTWLS